MPIHIPAPTRITAAGHPPKRIEEFAGRVNNGESRVSVAVMTSPAGWLEPAQRPEFDEYTVVIEGCLRVEHDGGSFDVKAGEAVLAKGGERVRYSTPHEGGARYVAVCLPAFAPDTVHREA